MATLLTKSITRETAAMVHIASGMLNKDYPLMVTVTPVGHLAELQLKPKGLGKQHAVKAGLTELWQVLNGLNSHSVLEEGPLEQVWNIGYASVRCDLGQQDILRAWNKGRDTAVADEERRAK